MFAFNSFAQSVYFAPRGKERIMSLGNDLSHSYLNPQDKLIGYIGEAGSGKSLLIRGMFPGLSLTNDDGGIYCRPLPILDDAENDEFASHTYHLDARFETAFTQPWQLAEAITGAVKAGRRVVVEHLDLLTKSLDLQADLLIGIGEEVLITRPGVFGPQPAEIKEIVSKSIIYRQMAHTAEDLTVTKVLEEEMGLERPASYGDVKSGFVLQFEEKPELDLDKLESRVQELITEDLTISFHDEQHIKLGEEVYPCSGPRIHVKSTGEIENFKLVRDLKQDPNTKRYLLAGLVGTERSQFQLSNKK
ncbi:alanine-tRNA synthetase second additional domain-containing protein [Fuchsiella alkaliacetigena]|uniref:alanine-tRNA synthetase second additional domain-containing protein n=1 Tax=Fuchsiella alkaliacetigena TaxID=957042 RepID=UPI00200AD77E|nr:alanine-tRNA synthetase second additional domain-containing protein [Fuchsiella alkaliacetigena]MCK8825343.1 alanine-tRNA synthetase second additional domain-containing protein [Fuchsiella alkaliacetigena]